MTAKQLIGRYAPDRAKYGTLTDGAGNLATTTTSSTGTAKQLISAQAADGSIYFCLTTGSGNLV